MGGGFQHPFCPPPRFSSFPFLFLSFAVAVCPPSGAGRGADPTAAAGGGGRSRPLPPSLPTFPLAGRPRTVAGRGLPVSASPDPRAMRGAMNEGGDPQPLFGRGGDSPFASARVGKGAKRLVVGVGGEAAQRPLREQEREVKLK